MRLLSLTVVLIAMGCHAVSGLDDFEVGEGGAKNVGGAVSDGGGGMAATSGGAGGVGGDGGGGGGGAPTGVPRDCMAVADADPTAGNGLYVIDPDGPGGETAFTAHCQMSILGGGWTRFHWTTVGLPQDTDPLGDTLHECNVMQPNCLGRIPAAATPTALLVRDRTDAARAAWTFDGSVISNAVLAALQNKVEVCAQDTPWDPYSENSSESFCGNGQENGCSAFMYTSGGCNGLPSWGMMLDGDQYMGAAAFKLGWTRSTVNTCGVEYFWDRAYLDSADCGDEFGELYYR